MNWTDLLKLSVRGGQVTIELRGDAGWIFLAYNQARAVLTDSRCPLRDRIPAEVARALGLPTRASTPR